MYEYQGISTPKNGLTLFNLNEIVNKGSVNCIKLDKKKHKSPMLTLVNRNYLRILFTEPSWLMMQ